MQLFSVDGFLKKKLDFLRCFRLRNFSRFQGLLLLIGCLSVGVKSKVPKGSLQHGVAYEWGGLVASMKKKHLCSFFPAKIFWGRRGGSLLKPMACDPGSGTSQAADEPTGG